MGFGVFWRVSLFVFCVFVVVDVGCVCFWFCFFSLRAGFSH